MSSNLINNERKCKDPCKVEVPIVDHVHLTPHLGHAMPTWMRSIFEGKYS
jgi:hypothetical protein